MKSLLNCKEKIALLLSRNEIYITPGVKFIIALAAMFIINNAYGYNSLLGNPGVILILALVCMFMPKTGIVYLLGFYSTAGVYSVSLEYFCVVVFIMLLVILLYMQFAPDRSYLIVLSGLAGALNIPFAVVGLTGLLVGPAAAVPVIGGTLLFYVLSYIPKYVEAMNAEESVTLVEKIQFIINNALINKEMILAIAASVLVIIVVYVLKRRNANYAWRTALIAGAVIYLAVMSVGGIVFDAGVSMVKLIIGTIIAFVICLAAAFFTRDLDYKRVEKVQFEDEDYYYYVKAVPKNKAEKDTKR